MARHPCDWPLGSWPRDIWLAVHSRTIPLIPYFTSLSCPPSISPTLLSSLSLCITLTGLLPKDNCSALCGLVGLFIPASWPWLVGRQRHDSYTQPHSYTTHSVSQPLQGGFFCDALGPISCDLPRRRCNSIVAMALGGAESGDIQQLIIHPPLLTVYQIDGALRVASH